MKDNNLTVTRQGPEVFQDNETGYGDTYTRPQRDYRPAQPRAIDFRVYAVWGVIAVAGLLIFFVIYSLWKWLYCMPIERWHTCQTLDAAEPIAFGLLFFAPLALAASAVLIKIRAHARYQAALAARANLVLNRFGDNEPADLFNRVSIDRVIEILAERYLLATELERQVAPHKIYRGVNSLSLSSANNAQKDDSLHEAPDDRIAPVPPDQWLTWINDTPHILLAAATGKGKTTTAKAIINERYDRGDQLFVIDPHSDDWYGLPVRGGGENWIDVQDAIQDVYDEYRRRQDARHQYLLVTGASMPVEAHQALTIIVDEAFLIRQRLDTGNKKGVTNFWEMLAETLGSGARKVNISVILLTQSPNVDDLGLSGAMRRNFTRIAIDAETIKLMIAQEERDSDYRQRLYEALIGLRYPATTVIDSRVVLLDRTGLDVRAARTIDAAARLWQPPFVRSRPADPHENGPSRTNERTNGDTIGELVAMRRQGITREQARRVRGMTFTDSDWTTAGAIIDADT